MSLGRSGTSLNLVFADLGVRIGIQPVQHLINTRIPYR